ncbi:hypothetical protein ACFWZS_08320 [[Kitasatospora] papulosa]|uniref:hypothetical protein n=1 Tax=[Kitasatospora] papulosa TaxID=1464011 RepID=UPI0036A73088
MLELIDRARHTISFVRHFAEPDSFALTALAQWLDTSPGGMATTAEDGKGMESGTEGTTPSNPVQQLAAHVRDQLGAGPFSQADGWTHMGAVISDASFQARSRYKATILLAYSPCRQHGRTLPRSRASKHDSPRMTSPQP